MQHVKPCQTRGWWIVMVIFVADELFCGRILVLLLLFIICWELATCFYLERGFTLQGKLLYLHVYINTYMNMPSLLPQILVSLASLFLHEVPLEEWCLNGVTGQHGVYGLDQERVCLLEWVLSCGRNSSDLPPPAARSSPNRSHILCSHGWLHARCGHSAHLQPHAKNNGNPLVHLSLRRCNSPTTLGNQHGEGWEVEQLLPAQASDYACCNFRVLCSKPCVPQGQDQMLYTTELPWFFQTWEWQPKSSGAALFKPKLESSMNMNNTSCTLASIIYFDIEVHLS